MFIALKKSLLVTCHYCFGGKEQGQPFKVKKKKGW